MQDWILNDINLSGAPQKTFIMLKLSEDMNKNKLEILACPQCKSSLKLTEETIEGDEVVLGALNCEVCGLVFKIIDGIPNFLSETDE